MADNPAAQEAVSREAHTRVVTERDQLKAQVAELTGQVQEASLMNAALGAFTTQYPDASVENILWATRTALPHLRGLEGDDLTAKVKSDFARLIPQAPPKEEAQPPGDDDGTNDPKVPTADTRPAPGWAQPTPTGPGEQPGNKQFDPMSPEMRRLRETNMEEFRRLDREGQIAWRVADLPAGFGPNPKG